MTRHSSASASNAGGDGERRDDVLSDEIGGGGSGGGGSGHADSGESTKRVVVDLKTLIRHVLLVFMSIPKKVWRFCFGAVKGIWQHPTSNELPTISSVNASNINERRRRRKKKKNSMRKKGILGFLQTIASVMLLFYMGLLASSHSLKSDDPWMKEICNQSIISLISSGLLAAFSVFFKDSQLTGHKGFQVFKILLLLQFLHFYIVLLIILRVRTQVSLVVILSFGIPYGCIIVLVGAECIDELKLLKKWIKSICNKMGCCLSHQAPTRRRRARRARP